MKSQAHTTELWLWPWDAQDSYIKLFQILLVWKSIWNQSSKYIKFLQYLIKQQKKK